MKLFVLEGKVGRLQMLCREGDSQGIKRELGIMREWGPSRYPAWLVFEVEHCIHIWPEQSALAMHLIENTGDIVQLNMGFGKTRVIIPSLVLHFAFHCTDSSTPRINILSSLFSEACKFFHGYLTGSVFNLPLVTLTFSRDVEIAREQVLAMRSLLSFCRERSGFVVAMPVDRLSLELMVKELALAGRK